MKSFSQVLDATQRTLQAEPTDANTPNTPQAGLTASSGRPTGNPNISYGLGTPQWATEGTRLPAPATRPNGLTLSDGPDGQPKTPLKRDREGQEELTLLLSQTFASQKTYGDKAEMMGYRDSMFQLILAEYPIEAIRAAFIEHIRRKPDLPTPSDIVNLIDPPKPELSSAMYVKLRQQSQEGAYLTGDERAFLRAYEAQELAKARS